MSIKELSSSNLVHFEGCSELEIFEYALEAHSTTGQNTSVFSDESRSIETIYESVDDVPCPFGYSWMANWKIDRSFSGVDEEGWTAICQEDDFVRRRRWYRVIQPSIGIGDMEKSGLDFGAVIYPLEDTSDTLVRRQSLRRMSDASAAAIDEASLAASGRGSLNGEADKTGTLLTAVVFENQRCMLSEWGGNNLMPGLDWPPWSDTTGYTPVQSLHEIELIEGYDWLDDWHVDKLRGRTDCEGFYYASSFESMAQLLEVKATDTSGDHVTGSGEDEDGGGCVVRTRRWLRHMVISDQRDAVLCSPFELVVHVSHLLPVDDAENWEEDRLRVSLEVGEEFVGVTGQQQLVYDTGHRFSWQDSVFSLPLVSLFPQQIRFKVYRELVAVGGTESGCRGELIAWAQDDLLLEKEVWRRPNRKGSFKLPISPSHSTLGFLCVDVELVEHSVLYFSGQVPRAPSLASVDDPFPAISGPNDRYDGSTAAFFWDYIRGGMVTACQNPSLGGGTVDIHSDLPLWLVHNLLGPRETAIDFPTEHLMFLNRVDIRDVVNDVSSMFTDGNASVMPLSVYPFPSPLSYRGVLAVETTSLDCVPDSGTAADLAKSVSRGSPASSRTSSKPVSAPPFMRQLMPPSRRMYECIPHLGEKDDYFSADSVKAPPPCLYYASIVTHSGKNFPFQWTEEGAYLDWMRVMSQCMRDGSVDTFSQTLRSSYFSSVNSRSTLSAHVFEPAVFEIIATEGVVQVTLVDSSTSSSDHTEQFRLLISDVDYLTTDSTFDFAARYLLEIDVTELHAPEFRPGSDHLAVITVVTSSGQVDHAQLYYRDLHTVGRRQQSSPDGSLLPKKTLIQLYFSAENVLKGDDVLVSLHLCTASDGVKTIGEKRVSLSELLSQSIAPQREEVSRDAVETTGSSTSSPVKTVSPTIEQQTGGEGVPPSPSGNLPYGCVPVSPKRLNRKAVAASNAASSAPATATIGQLAMNVQTTKTVYLQPPRQAIIMKFNCADIIIRAIKNFTPSKSKSAEVFCTMTFVDGTGSPVGVGNNGVFRTHGVELASSVQWSQEAVFDSSSTGLLRAVYSHIEVWHSCRSGSNSSSDLSCLGEVYLPLKNLSERYVESTLPLMWSPKMPAQFKSEFPSFGSITVGAKIYGSVVGGTDTGDITFKSSLCLAPATSSGWTCRSISPGSSDTSVRKLDYSDCFVANLTGPALILNSFDTAMKSLSCWGQFVSVKPPSGSRILSSSLSLDSSGASPQASPQSEERTPRMLKRLSGTHVSPSPESPDAKLGRRLTSVSSSQAMARELSKRLSSTSNLLSSSFSSSSSGTVAAISISALAAPAGSAAAQAEVDTDDLARPAGELVASREAEGLGNSCCVKIPWRQVVDVEVISNSAVIITVDVHVSSSDYGGDGHDNSRVSTLELLMGPCPARSVELLVRERMGEEDIHAKLEAELSRQRRVEGEKPFLHLRAARDILVKLAFDIKETKRFLHLLQKKYSRHQNHIVRAQRSSENTAVDAGPLSDTRDGKKESIFCSMLKNPFSLSCVLLEVWSYHVSRLFRLLCYAAVLLKQSYLTCRAEMERQEPSYYSEEGIAQHMDANTEYFEYQCFRMKPEVSLGSDEGTEKRNDGPVPNSTPSVYRVKEFVDLAENYALDMILLGWNHFTHIDRLKTPAKTLTTEIAHSSVALPPIAPYLDILINGYYNRTISLVGKCISNFDKFESVRSKLELIHFVVTTDSRLALSIVDALAVIGLHLTPSPTLSLTLHLDDLLDELPGVVSGELDNFISNALRSGKTDGDRSSFPWTIHKDADTGLLVGPIPRLILDILSSYMKLTAPLPDSSSFTTYDEGRREEGRLRRMNDIIAVQTISSYTTLVTAYESILIHLKSVVDAYADSSGRGERADNDEDVETDPDAPYPSCLSEADDISSILYFLCSLCNDCEKVCTSHLHLLAGKVSHPSTEFRSRVAKIESDLMYVGWTAVEIITKIIFTDTEDAFKADFAAVWNSQTSPLLEVMQSLQAYMTDMQRCLAQEYLQKLVISCGRKLIRQYFMMLYSHSQQIEDTNKRMVREVEERPKLSSLLQRIPSFGFKRIEDQKQLLLEKEERELQEVHQKRVVFDSVHIQQIQEDVERMATFCARNSSSVSPFQNSELSAQFSQINAFVCALEADYSESYPEDFMRAIQELVMLGGTAETVSCITTLKDLDRASADAVIQLAFPSSQSIEPSAQSSPASGSSSQFQYTRPAILGVTSNTTPAEYISSGGRSLHDVSYSASWHGTSASGAARARDISYCDMLDAEEESLGLGLSHHVEEEVATSSDSASIEDDVEDPSRVPSPRTSTANKISSQGRGRLNTGPVVGGVTSIRKRSGSGSSSRSSLPIPRVIASNRGGKIPAMGEAGGSEIRVCALRCRRLRAGTAMDFSAMNEQKLVVRVRCGPLMTQTGRARCSRNPLWAETLIFPVKPPLAITFEVLKCEPKRNTRVNILAECALPLHGLSPSLPLDVWIPLHIPQTLGPMRQNKRKPADTDCSDMMLHACVIWDEGSD